MKEHHMWQIYKYGTVSLKQVIRTGIWGSVQDSNIDWSMIEKGGGGDSHTVHVLPMTIPTSAAQFFFWEISI